MTIRHKHQHVRPVAVDQVEHGPGRRDKVISSFRHGPKKRGDLF